MKIKVTIYAEVDKEELERSVSVKDEPLLIMQNIEAYDYEIPTREEWEEEGLDWYEEGEN